jgi:hypothetical protein
VGPVFEDVHEKGVVVVVGEVVGDDVLDPAHVSGGEVACDVLKLGFGAECGVEGGGVDDVVAVGTIGTCLEDG